MKIAEPILKEEVSNPFSAVPRYSSATILACAWPALLLATACLLPYLNKAFLIDDPHFLAMARQIIQHPTHPMDFMECWTMIPDCTKAYLLSPGNALMGYVLVPTVLAGAHEWMAHLTQLVLVWIAVIAITSLILRFARGRGYAMVSALLLVVTAPFLPMASTAMADILGTTLAVVAMERLAAWKAEQKWSQGTVAGIALGLAGFARAHLALLLPLAAFYLLDSAEPRHFVAQIRRRFWLWTPVLIGSGELLAIIAITREHNLALAPTSAFTGLPNILPNLGAYLFYLVFPFPLGACWAMNRLKNAPLRIAIFVATALACDLIFHAGLVLFLVLMGLGMIGDLLYEALDKADHSFLFLMLWIMVPLPIVYNGHLPAKYLLPCMPAVILLCFRLMQDFPLRLCRVAAVAGIIVGAGYSLLILHADAEFANFGRESMYELIQPHVAAGQTVWFDGQAAAYWYAPLAGAKLTFPGGPQPKPGDLLVVGMQEGGRLLVLPRFPHRTLVQAITHHYSFGRTEGGGFGLYSNRLGYWMWGFGKSPNDRYELWRID